MNAETREILLRGGLTLADLWSGPCCLPDWLSDWMSGAGFCRVCEHKGTPCKLPVALTEYLAYQFAAYVEQREWDAAHPETVRSPERRAA